jgi:hypothetical protein
VCIWVVKIFFVLIFVFIFWYTCPQYWKGVNTILRTYCKLFYNSSCVVIGVPLECIPFPQTLCTFLLSNNYVKFHRITLKTTGKPFLRVCMVSLIYMYLHKLILRNILLQNVVHCNVRLYNTNQRMYLIILVIQTVPSVCYGICYTNM